MAVATHAVRPTGFAATERRDAWWVAPLVQGLLLATLICYANWAAIQGNDYYVPHAGGGGYLSPFYSPLIIIPGFPYSPALLILLPPILFRATCYYYRKAYYRSYFLDPPACAVGEPRGHGYRGETAFPFILQNLHRYATRSTSRSSTSSSSGATCSRRRASGAASASGSARSCC